MFMHLHSEHFERLEMSRTLFYLRFIAQCFPTKWDFISLLVTSIDDETCSLNETASTQRLLNLDNFQFWYLLWKSITFVVHAVFASSTQDKYFIKWKQTYCGACVCEGVCIAYMHVAKVFDFEWMTSIMLLKLMENLVASTARFTIKEWMHACMRIRMASTH